MSVFRNDASLRIEPVVPRLDKSLAFPVNTQQPCLPTHPERGTAPGIEI